jgi:uncharacterized protein YjbJ (UPF0337 family)
MLQKRYGFAKDEAEKEYKDFMDRQSKLVSTKR